MSVIGVLYFAARFKENTGPYVVNLRLTQTQAQNLIFRYNRLIDNSITFSGTILKPRSRARAVVVISSRFSGYIFFLFLAISAFYFYNFQWH